MDNSQFQIPIRELIPTPELIQDVESIFDTPEIRELLSAFDEIKAIEQSIETLRSSATELNLPNRTRIELIRETVARLFVTNNAPKTLEAKLIEVEATRSKAILPNAPHILSQRLWYHQGDWFYELHDVIGPMVARYQFIDGSAAKLIDGKLVPFADGEADSLYKVVPLYHDVISEMYSTKADGSLAT
jgi:hypothetical protein